MNAKKIHKNSLLGQRGINLIERRVLEMGFIWYPTGSVEAGIDGQGFTPLLVLAHLNVESLPLAHGTEDGVHPVNAAVLGQLLHTTSPNLG